MLVGNHRNGDERMKNENVLRVLIFICSLIFVSAAFFAGYYVVQNIYETPKEITAFLEENAKTQYFSGATNQQNALKWPSVPNAVHRGLVLSSGEQQRVFITVLASGSGKLKVIEIPEDTRIYLSGEQYKKYTVTYPALPQMFQISVLKGYMNADETARFLGEVLSATLYCSFAHITSVESEKLNLWFDVTGEDLRPGVALENLLAAETSGAERKERLETYCAESGISDGQLSYFSDDWNNLRKSDIIFSEIPGEREKDGFRIELNQARLLINGE